MTVHRKSISKVSEVRWASRTRYADILHLETVAAFVGRRQDYAATTRHREDATGALEAVTELFAVINGAELRGRKRDIVDEPAPNDMLSRLNELENSLKRRRTE